MIVLLFAACTGNGGMVPDDISGDWLGHSGSLFSFSISGSHPGFNRVMTAINSLPI